MVKLIPEQGEGRGPGQAVQLKRATRQSLRRLLVRCLLKGLDDALNLRRGVLFSKAGPVVSKFRNLRFVRQIAG